MTNASQVRRELLPTEQNLKGHLCKVCATLDRF